MVKLLRIRREGIVWNNPREQVVDERRHVVMPSVRKLFFGLLDVVRIEGEVVALFHSCIMHQLRIVVIQKVLTIVCIGVLCPHVTPSTTTYQLATI